MDTFPGTNGHRNGHFHNYTTPHTNRDAHGYVHIFAHTVTNSYHHADFDQHRYGNLNAQLHPYTTGDGAALRDEHAPRTSGHFTTPEHGAACDNANFHSDANAGSPLSNANG